MVQNVLYYIMSAILFFFIIDDMLPYLENMEGRAGWNKEFFVPE